MKILSYVYLYFHFVQSLHTYVYKLYNKFLKNSILEVVQKYLYFLYIKAVIGMTVGTFISYKLI